MDYAHPDGEQMTVALGRLKAKNQSARRGSVFYNPGGPGAPAIPTLSFATASLTPEVLDQYDFVAVDPRGVGVTEPLDCKLPTVVKAPPLPWNPGDSAAVIKANQVLHQSCRAANPRIARFMTTADLARDLDRARAALGDEKFTFYGTSYGSVVGATYAAMFPANVRAVAVDSAIDTIAYTHGRNGEGVRVPSLGRIGSVYGAQVAHRALIDDCERAQETSCPQGKTLREDWSYLLEQLNTKPAALPNGTTVDFQYFTARLLSAFYSLRGVRQVPAFVTELAKVHRQQYSGRATLSAADNTVNMSALDLDDSTDVRFDVYGLAFAHGLTRRIHHALELYRVQNAWGAVFGNH